MIDYNIFLDDPIKERLPQLIESFVKFYGEKYREKITNNLNNTFFIYVQKPEEEIENIQMALAQIREDRIYQYYNDNNLDSFSIDEFPKLDFEKWIEDLRNKNKVPPLLSKFVQEYLGYSQSNTYFSLDSKQSKKMIIDLLQNHLTNYYECKNDLDKLFALQEKLYEESNLREKLLLNFNDENSKILQNYLKNTLKIENFDKFKPILSDFCEIIIKDPAFRTQEDKTTMEKFWHICQESNRSLKHENFDEFVNNKALIKQLSSLHNDYIENLLSSYPSVKKVMDEIDNKGLFKGTILSSIENYIRTPSSNVIAFVEPTFYKNDPSTLYSFCVLPTIFNANDYTIFHELNHIAVSNMISNNENCFVVKTGLQVSNFDKDFNISIGSTQKMFVNEVINDYIALKICQEFEYDNNNIGLLNNSPSTFSKAFPLLKDFINDNLADIIDCLMDKNKNISNIIGADNFDMLADATKNILINKDSSKIFEELTSRYGIDDINKIIDIDNLQLNENEDKYINNFRQANYVTNKLRLQKLLLENKSILQSKPHPNDLKKDNKENIAPDFDFSDEIK